MHLFKKNKIKKYTPNVRNKTKELLLNKFNKLNNTLKSILCDFYLVILYNK